MIWLDPEQLKKLGVSKGILHRNRDVWKFRDSGLQGRNGKVIKEVLLESMQPKFQQEYLDQRSRSLTTELDSPVSELIGTAGEPHVTGDGGERRLTEALLRYRPEMRDAFLAEAQRLSSIVKKYDAIKPKRQKSADGAFEFVPEIHELCEQAVCIEPIVLAAEPSRSEPPSPYTIEAWSKKYRELGLAAFLRKAPAATGQTDGRKVTISAGAVEFINKHFNKTPSPRKLHEKLEREARKHNWQIPSYGWIWRKYKDLPKIVSTLNFKGEKAYQGKYAPFVPRTVTDLAALQMLCGDHSIRDVTVMLPDGTLTRPWLTTWYDMRTGLIWGWHLDLTPSSATIALAYANGIKTFGAQPLPNPDADFYSYLYTDQGKDYRCKLLTGETIEFKKAARIEGGLGVLCEQRRVGFMDEMGIKHLMARGYNAKEKPVERVHADISRWEQNYFENEYCGRGTEHKPDAWTRSWHRHSKLLKKHGDNIAYVAQESPFMTLEDYRENLANWIVEFNCSAHTRSVLGGAKTVPVEEYERLYTTKYEIADDALALLLMKAKKRKIGKDGIQMFQSHWYFLHEAMSEFKGEEVEVRYTDGDLSKIWAILPNKQVVEASLITPSSILNPNKKTMEAVAKQRNHERKVVREFRFIQESNYRGESTEDRVAMQINGDNEPEPQQQKIAVNAGPTVRNLTRFDRTPIATGGRRSATAADFEGGTVIEGMFGNSTSRSQPAIKEEWED